MNTVAAPSPSSATPAPPNSPAPIDAAPNPVTAIPAIARRLLRPERSTATSRNAAIGATLLARRAGNTAETTLTSVPATGEELITVPLEITTDPDGRSMPIADIIHASPAVSVRVMVVVPFDRWRCRGHGTLRLAADALLTST